MTDVQIIPCPECDGDTRRPYGPCPVCGNQGVILVGSNPIPQGIGEHGTRHISTRNWELFSLQGNRKRRR